MCSFVIFGLCAGTRPFLFYRNPFDQMMFRCADQKMYRCTDRRIFDFIAANHWKVPWKDYKSNFSIPRSPQRTFASFNFKNADIHIGLGLRWLRTHRLAQYVKRSRAYAAGSLFSVKTTDPDIVSLFVLKPFPSLPYSPSFT